MTTQPATATPADPGRARSFPTDAHRAERGQATAEYALVMLAAAALAGLLLAWAATTDGVERLANTVMDTIIGDAT